MIQNASERLAVSLLSLLCKINDHCCKLSDTPQPIGLCTVNPKHASVPPPTRKIQSELKMRAKEHFKKTHAVGCYFRYWTPPMLPIVEDNNATKDVTAENYQLSFGLPQFDNKWQQTVIARNLIYCPLDPGAYEWSDWFELQLDAIRLVPLLDQTLKELMIKSDIENKLHLPAKPVFESFIYEYASGDSHFPEMSKSEKEKWKTKQVNWKDRYRLAEGVIKPAKTLQDLYLIARQKAASTRNPMLKSLFKAFVEYVERNLINVTNLPEKQKDRLLCQLRQTKKRTSKEKYIAKRPAVCISDVECAQVLYVMIQEYLATNIRDKALAEAIIFIWVAQHGAFSGLHLKVNDILSIRVTDIDFLELTIHVNNQEIYIIEGLKEILADWLGNTERKNQRKLFQNITYDSLEDIISKFSSNLYGSDKSFSPRDFLEKVHVIPGARVSLELRRQITAQEEIIKNSPYRIDSRDIKKHIIASIKNK